MAKLDLLGKKYFIMTKTGNMLGQIDEFSDGLVKLSTASRVCTRGSFSLALSSGTLEEVEYMGDDIYLQTFDTTAFYPWNHALPTVST